MVARHVAEMNDPVARPVRCRDRSRRGSPDTHQAAVAKANTATMNESRNSGKAVNGNGDRRNGRVGACLPTDWAPKSLSVRHADCLSDSLRYRQGVEHQVGNVSSRDP